SGTLPGNTIANPKGELKATTTRNGLVTEGPTVPNPPKPVNPKEDECVEETYTDPDHAEYNIKVPSPPLIASPKVIHEFHDSKGCTFLSEEFPDIDSFNDIYPYFDDDPLSGSTTYSANSLLEEFADELALISYPPDYDDNHFSKDDVLFSPDNEDKVFNPGILSHEKSVKIITCFAPEKKLAVSFASWLFEDIDPPFSELLVFKEVPNSMRLLPFSSENE
nr:hypothetical protein [Tanacetum cinerariifolium]